MKQIYLMRHGDAPNQADDKSRRISPLGRVEAVLMGAFLTERLAIAGLPRIDHAAVSDAPRTTETYTAMRLANAPAVPAVVPALYTAAALPVVDHLRSLVETVTTALVVSHHPSVDRVVALLTGQAPTPGAATGCIASLVFEGDWAGLGPETAELLWRVAPDEALDILGAL